MMMESELNGSINDPDLDLSVMSKRTWLEKSILGNEINTKNFNIK